MARTNPAALRKDVPRSARGGSTNVPAWSIQADDDAPPVTVAVPALTALARDSAAVIAKAGDAGMLGDLAREIDAIEAARLASAALGNASRYERLAAQVSDPVDADGYRQLAKAVRGAADGVTGHLARARQYESQASRVATPADQQAYLELARRERGKAGV
jgi:hypothetical protein